MQTSPIAPQPVRLPPIHAFSSLDGADQEPRRREDHDHPRAALIARATPVAAAAQARPNSEPLADWQVFTLLGGSALALVTAGVGGLYALSLLLA
jgi:hypothetical protein